MELPTHQWNFRHINGTSDTSMELRDVAYIRTFAMGTVIEGPEL